MADVRRLAALLGGGFNRLVNGMPSPFLSPEEQVGVADQRRMSMATALLQMAGRVPQGTGPGAFGALGNALQSGQPAQDEAEQAAIRMRMLRQQMEQYDAQRQWLP